VSKIAAEIPNPSTITGDLKKETAESIICKCVCSPAEMNREPKTETQTKNPETQTVGRLERDQRLSFPKVE